MNKISYFKFYYLIVLFSVCSVAQANDFDPKVALQNFKSQTRFLENKGQLVDVANNPVNDVLFYTHVGSQPLSVYFRKNSWSLVVYKANKYIIDDSNLLEIERERVSYEYHRIDVELVNANSNVKVRGINQLALKEAFLKPNVELYDVSSFGGLYYENIYEGIDVKFYVKDNILKYEFIVHPGADFNQIKLRYKGGLPDLSSNKLSYNIPTSIGNIEEDKLDVFYERSGEKTSLPVQYVLSDSILSFDFSRVSSELCKHHTIIIDPPVRVWGAYIGGIDGELVTDLEYFTYNGQNLLAICGRTKSTNFPVSTGANQGLFGGSYDAFYALANPITGAIVYATYFGSSLYDMFLGLDIQDSLIALVGTAEAIAGFHATPGTHYYGTYVGGVGGNLEGIVQVFHLNTHQRVWGTIVDVGGASGGNNERVHDVKFDLYKGLYVVGSSNCTRPIDLTSNNRIYFNDGYHVKWRNRQEKYYHHYDGFLIRLNAITGKGFFGTFISSADTSTTNTNNQYAYSLVVRDTTLFVGLTTEQTMDNSVVTNGSFDDTYNGGTRDLLVVSFDSTGNFLWGAYYGGNGDEENTRLLLVDDSDIHPQPFLMIFGNTNATNLVTTTNALNASNSGNKDLCIGACSLNGTSLLYSTYIGGQLDDLASTLAYDDSTNRLYIACNTQNSNLNTNNNSHQPNHNNPGTAANKYDGYIASYTINQLTQPFTFNWGTYYGGSQSDIINGMDYDDLGSIYLAGNTNSNSTGALKDISTINSYNGGSSDGFYAKLCVGNNNDLPVTANIISNPICQYDTLRFNAIYNVINGTFDSLRWSSRYANPIFTSNQNNDSIVNVNYIHEGIYSLLVYSNSGEIGCDAQRVTVNYTPVPYPYSSPPSPVCEYNDVTLYSAQPGHATYQWVGPNSFTSNSEEPVLLSVTNTQNEGNYSVTVTTSNGCVGTGTFYLAVIDSANMYLTLDPIPGDSICKGSTFNLTVNGVTGSSSFVWSDNSFPNQSFISGITATNDATYTVTVTNPASCFGTATRQVTVYSIDAQQANLNLMVQPPVICFGSGDSISVWVTGGGQYSNYVWSEPSVGYADSGRVYFSSSQYLHVTVTDPLACAGNLTVGEYIQVVNNVYLAAFTNSPLCEGSTLNIQVVTDGTPTIILPNQTTYSGSNYTINNAQVADGGTYRVIAVNSNGCKDSVDVTIIVSDQSLIVFNSGPVCEGGTLQLFSGSGTSYSWTGPNGFTSSQQNPIINNVTINNAGIYTVVVSGNGPCTGTGTTTVDINYGTVNAEITMVGNNPLCYGESAVLYVNTGGAYQWNNGQNTQAILITNTNNSSNMFNQTYSVMVTDISGCTNSTEGAQIDVTMAPNIDNGNGFLDTLYACINGFYMFEVCDTQNVIASPPYISYSISKTIYDSNGNNFCGGSLNPVTYAHQGYYYHVYNLLGSQCYDIDSLYLDVIDFNSSIQQSGTSCVGGTIQLSANAATDATWITPLNDTILSNPLSISPLTMEYEGMYSAIITDNNGCVDTLTVNVDVNQLTFGVSSNSPICIYDALQLNVTNPSSPIANYSWNGPSGFTSQDSNPQIVLTNNNQAGTYTVTATDANGCFNTAEINVVIYPTITPFTYDDYGTVMQNNPITINIIVNDSNVINTSSQIISGPYNGTVSIENGVITYTPNTNFSGVDSMYYVICDPLCINNCDTAKVRIIVNNKDIDVNQLITPNDDGVNDTWTIPGIENYPNNQVLIMNRWGDEIFRAQPYQNNWYGQSNSSLNIAGDKVTSGVYFYVIDLGDGSDVLKGYIVLEY